MVEGGTEYFFVKQHRIGGALLSRRRRESREGCAAHNNTYIALLGSGCQPAIIGVAQSDHHWPVNKERRTRRTIDCRILSKIPGIARIVSTATKILFLSYSSSFTGMTYTNISKWPHKKKSRQMRSDDLDGLSDVFINARRILHIPSRLSHRLPG